MDLSRAEPVKKLFPNVRVYQDWRELLRKEADNLDSVNVSTPDHMHAPIAMAAMSLGKHVYVQKPLATTVHETRMLAAAARKKRLVSQMGIQISSHPTQLATELMIRNGVIGKVREVHTFCNKTWGDMSPDPVRFGSGSRVARLGHVARRRREAAIQDGRLSSGQLAQASRLRHRHAR